MNKYKYYGSLFIKDCDIIAFLSKYILLFRIQNSKQLVNQSLGQYGGTFLLIKNSHKIKIFLTILIIVIL